ncbi:MAG: hypothetical protein QOI74_924, partial [Micromonosporaceae bacterium]|nr:hypothetical protein [Micromonosporaceae bacterium]
MRSSESTAQPPVAARPGSGAWSANRRRTLDSGRPTRPTNHGVAGAPPAYPPSSGRQGETRVTFWSDVPDEDREELEQLGWIRGFPAGVLILRENDASS